MFPARGAKNMPLMHTSDGSLFGTTSKLNITGNKDPKHNPSPITTIAGAVSGRFWKQPITGGRDSLDSTGAAPTCML